MPAQMVRRCPNRSHYTTESAPHGIDVQVAKHRSPPDSHDGVLLPGNARKPQSFCSRSIQLRWEPCVRSINAPLNHSLVQVRSSDNASLISLTRSATEPEPIETISNPKSRYVRS